MDILWLCIEIFFARIFDVSIGSVRTVFLVKQRTLIASIFAFVEILIWFTVAQQTINMDSPSVFIIISYAGGYATGTYIGGIISKYFVKGVLSAIIITNDSNILLVTKLKEASYGVSVLHLEENKILLLVEFKKKSLKKLKQIVNSIDENAFIIINETLHVENGYFN